MIKKIFLYYKIIDKRYTIFREVLVLISNIFVASLYCSYMIYNTYI